MGYSDCSPVIDWVMNQTGLSEGWEPENPIKKSLSPFFTSKNAINPMNKSHEH